MIGNIAESRWFRNAWRRRAVFAGAAAVLALASVFPSQYRASVSMVPADPATLGLSGALGQLGAFSSAFGNQAAIEIALRVARSEDVRETVSKEVHLVERQGLSNERAASRWLDRNVDIRSLRGGILQVELQNNDPKFSLEVVSAYTKALRARLGQISRTQTAYKRGLLTELVETSNERLKRAQAAYDTFRRTTRYAEPAQAIGEIGGRVPTLQAQLKAAEVALEAARAFATDDNMSVRQIKTEMQVLRSQLKEAESLDSTEPYAVNRVVIQSTQVAKLQRELNLAQSLYDNYKRFLEGTAVEDLASTGNVRILEPPFIDSAIQFRTIPAALFLLLVVWAILIEFYFLRPPVGSANSREWSAE